MAESEQYAYGQEYVYFRLDEGGAVAREHNEGREVFNPVKKEWVDASNMNFAVEARSIPDEEALAEVGGDEGEFAPGATG